MDLRWIVVGRFFEFKPHEPGLEKVLGGLESKVMDVVWSLGRCTVKDVHERLRAERDLAYTTVMTVMSRLAAKGLLKREPVDGIYYYEPAMSQDEFKKRVVSEVLAGLLDSFGEQTIAHLVGEISKQDEAKLEHLEKVIAELRRRKD